MTCFTWPFLNMTPSSPSRVPQLLLIAVISFTPLRDSACIRLLGNPAPPNPPNMMRAPSRMSATAASRELTIFCFILRSVNCWIGVTCRLFPTRSKCATPPAGRNPIWPRVAQKEKGARPSRPFLRPGTRNLFYALAREQSRHDDFLGLRRVLGHLNFQLAHGKFAAGVFSLDPDLVEEIFAADAVKNQLGGFWRFVDVARIGSRNRSNVFIQIAHRNEVGRGDPLGAKQIVAGRQHAISGDKVEGDSGPQGRRLGACGGNRQ